jgi:predicted branched-subunit amino acid permease
MLTVPDRRADPRIDRAAVRDIIPITLAVAPLGFVVGVTIPALGVPRGVGLAAAPLLYSGSTQLTFLTLAASGASLLALLGTLLLVNARLIVYSAAMAPLFSEQPAWFRLLTPTFVVDQTYALVIDRVDLHEPARFRRYWLTIGAVLGTGWAGAIACGVLLGPVVPDVVPIELTAPALFIGLVVPKLRDRRSVGAALLAAATAAAGHGALGPAAIPVAMTVAITALALADRRREPRSEAPS